MIARLLPSVPGLLFVLMVGVIVPTLDGLLAGVQGF